MLGVVLGCPCPFLGKPMVKCKFQTAVKGKCSRSCPYCLERTLLPSQKSTTPKEKHPPTKKENTTQNSAQPRLNAAAGGLWLSVCQNFIVFVVVSLSLFCSCVSTAFVHTLHRIPIQQGPIFAETINHSTGGKERPQGKTWPK